MTQNNLIVIVTMWNKVNELSRENLSQRHEKQPKNPAKNDRKQIQNWNFDEWMQKLKGLVAASLILKTLDDKTQFNRFSSNKDSLLFLSCSMA